MVDEHGVLPPNPDFTGTRLNLYLWYIDIISQKVKQVEFILYKSRPHSVHFF